MMFVKVAFEKGYLKPTNNICYKNAIDANITNSIIRINSNIYSIDYCPCVIEINRIIASSFLEVY